MVLGSPMHRLIRIICENRQIELTLNLFSRMRRISRANQSGSAAVEGAPMPDDLSSFSPVLSTPPDLPAAGLDAELINACRRHDVFEMDLRALELRTSGVSDNEFDAVSRDVEAAQEPYAEVIVNQRAATLTGLKTRARTLLLYADSHHLSNLLGSSHKDERFLGALLRDLIALPDDTSSIPCSDERICRH
jgi:hypothetical protein